MEFTARKRDWWRCQSKNRLSVKMSLTCAVRRSPGSTFWDLHRRSWDPESSSPYCVVQVFFAKLPCQRPWLSTKAIKTLQQEPHSLPGGQSTNHAGNFRNYPWPWHSSHFLHISGFAIKLRVAEMELVGQGLHMFIMSGPQGIMLLVREWVKHDTGNHKNILRRFEG